VLLTHPALLAEPPQSLAKSHEDLFRNDLGHAATLWAR
jgi:hypothetical protein